MSELPKLVVSYEMNDIQLTAESEILETYLKSVESVFGVPTNDYKHGRP